MQRFRLAAAAASMFLFVGWAPCAEPELQPMVEYPSAGVSVALPAGFALGALTEPFDILRASRTSARRPVHAISLSAVYTDQDVSAEQFSQLMAEQLAQNLAIRKLEELKKVDMPVAGQNGVARLLSYTFRGEKTYAARVYFTRKLNGGPGGVCYMLTVESAEKHRDEQLPILGAVVKSLSFIPIRRPIDLPVEKFGEAIQDFRLGYALRPPQHWFAASSATGLAMGRTDYLRQGGLWPSAQLIVSPVAKGQDSATCAKAALERAHEVARKTGMSLEVAAEGPAKLGALDAQQVLIRQRPKDAPATAATTGAATCPVLIAQRTVCTTNPAGEPTAYTLVVICQDCTDKQLLDLTESLSSGFEVIRAKPTVRK